MKIKPLAAGTIKRLRATLRMTQKQFAAKLRVSMMTIHRWEHGIVSPDETNSAKLRKLLDKTRK